MKIVVAMDAWKDCCTALAASEAVARGLQEICPQSNVIIRPMADGGEGTAAVLQTAMGGQWMDCKVQGPLAPACVNARYLWLESTHTAVVEMAQASGLHRLSEPQRDPMRTGSYGTGQLIQEALDQGAERILLAVGGSATVDLGIGMAAALGWSFLDEHHKPVEPVGQSLLKIEQINRPAHDLGIEVRVLCDVSNPLLGQEGAAKVYAPQKGASRSDVVLLEVGLTHVANLIRRQFNMEVDGIPGGGAAGGLAAGAAVFLGATLVSGVEAVMSETGLLEELRDADFVITGEGRFDTQSFFGKVINGIARACDQTTTQVIVLAGQIHLNQEQYRLKGVSQAISCTPADMSLQEALKQGPQLLYQSAKHWAQETLV